MTHTQFENAVEFGMPVYHPFPARLTVLPGEKPTEVLVLDGPLCGARVPYPGRADDGAPFLAECIPCDFVFNVVPGAVYSTSERD